VIVDSFHLQFELRPTHSFRKEDYTETVHQTPESVSAPSFSLFSHRDQWFFIKPNWARKSCASTSNQFFLESCNMRSLGHHRTSWRLPSLFRGRNHLSSTIWFSPPDEFFSFLPSFKECIDAIIFLNPVNTGKHTSQPKSLGRSHRSILWWQWLFDAWIGLPSSLFSFFHLLNEIVSQKRSGFGYAFSNSNFPFFHWESRCSIDLQSGSKPEQGFRITSFPSLIRKRQCFCLFRIRIDDCLGNWAVLVQPAPLQH